jgi:hypothetical protein
MTTIYVSASSLRHAAQGPVEIPSGSSPFGKGDTRRALERLAEFERFERFERIDKFETFEPFERPETIDKFEPFESTEKFEAFEYLKTFETLQKFEKFRIGTGPRRKRDASDMEAGVPAASSGAGRHQSEPPGAHAAASETRQDDSYLECEDPEDPSQGPAVMKAKTVVASDAM